MNVNLIPVMKTPSALNRKVPLAVLAWRDILAVASLALVLKVFLLLKLFTKLDFKLAKTVAAIFKLLAVAE